jgi:hypothetical protein
MLPESKDIRGFLPWRTIIILGERLGIVFVKEIKILTVRRTRRGCPDISAVECKCDEINGVVVRERMPSCVPISLGLVDPLLRFPMLKAFSPSYRHLLGAHLSGRPSSSAPKVRTMASVISAVANALSDEPAAKKPRTSKVCIALANVLFYTLNSRPSGYWDTQRNISLR